MAAKRPSSKAKTPTKKKAEVPDVQVAPPPVVGKKAPDFTLSNQKGEKVQLSKLKGNIVVLYFYPRDMTQGCTVEACGFRDLHPQFKKIKAVVLGVSRDTEAKHQKFIDKEKLPFDLLSDPEAKVIGAYGSWGEKKFMGRTSMGILRTTVLIDKTGKVAKVYPRVNTKTHAEDVQADILELGL